MINNIKSFVKIRPALLVGFLFCTSSLLFGIWVAAIPSIKVKFSFSDASLGLSLLLSPLGAITGIFLSTYIFRKVAVGKWLIIGYLMLCLIVITQVNAVNKLQLWICLYFFGLCSFLNGVASNATVTLLEKKYNRLLMSTCHGMYSLGGALSALLAFLLFSIGIASGWQIVIVASCIFSVIIINRKTYLQHTNIIHNKNGLQLPNKSIVGIAFICLVTFMAEGCVADWSAIYFKEILHSPKAFVSFGYAGFSLAMTVGRLNGDQLIKNIGAKKMVIIGTLIASLGFLIVCLVPPIYMAVAGYIFIGIGCCTIVPVLFSASAKIPGVSTVQGFAMVTTGGLIGFLAGPSVIGFVSEKVNLANAMFIVVFLMLAATIVAWKNKFLV